MIVSGNTIQTETIYLASFDSFRDESCVFAMVATAAQPDDYHRYEFTKVRFPLAKNASYNAGSTRALVWAKNYISPSVNTILKYSLPYEPDEIDFSFFPRLELEAVSRDENPAWFELTKAARVIRAS